MFSYQMVICYCSKKGLKKNIRYLAIQDLFVIQTVNTVVILHEYASTIICNPVPQHQGANQHNNQYRSTQKFVNTVQLLDT